MKKIILGLTLMLFLTGCAETLAFLGPVGSAATGGNAMHSSLTSAATYGIKKSTGKSALEHASSFAEKHNPGRKKVKCVSFLESTGSSFIKNFTLFFLQIFLIFFPIDIFFFRF